MQIRTRLTLWFIGITALLLLSSLIFIYINFNNHIKAEFYESLESKAVMTVVMLEKNNPELDTKIEKKEEKQENDVLPSKENIIVFNTKFEKLFSFNKEDQISESILRTILAKGEHKFALGMYDAVGIKYTTNFGKELIIISKGVFLSQEVIRLGNILMITFFLFLTFTAVGGYYFAGKALQPITKTMNEIDKMLPSDLAQRLNVDNNNDELSRLSFTFNKLLDRIEDAFKIQKGFLSNVSHELRNPLASIISSIQVNLSKDRATEEYKTCLNNILHEAIDLEHTSTHLMELARISANSDKILFDKTRIDELIWQAISTVKKSSHQYAIRFDTHNLPEDSEKLNILANDALVKTALINLLENACKFSPDHQALINLNISENQFIAIEIKDSAPKILSEDKELIFKPFYRSNATNKIKGSGIGLSLVASIVNIHKAKLTISNNEGEVGNIFTMTFPIKNL